MAKRFQTLYKFLLFNGLRFLSFFAPKNPHIWVFGEFYGRSFSGNPKYFFMYLLRYSKGALRPIWLSSNDVVIDEVQHLGGEAYRINSLKALYFGLRAKVYVYSHGVEDVGNYAVRKAVLINLWHGMPIKDIRKFERLKSENISLLRQKKIRFIQRLIKYEEKGNYDLIISTSDLTAKTFESAFLKRPKKIVITGEPKNDLFFLRSRNEILQSYGLHKWVEKTIITYMPTFRDKRLPKPSQIAFWENLTLPKNDTVLLLHWHPSDPLRKVFSVVKTPFVQIANNLSLDVQELLLISDILVTDYSSCFIDFLLLDRPVVFFAYDLEDYRKYRGFLYEYEQISPGAITHSKEETARVIEMYAANPQLDFNKRQKKKKMFHKYQKGPFSPNVLREITLCLATKDRG